MITLSLTATRGLRAAKALTLAATVLVFTGCAAGSRFYTGKAVFPKPVPVEVEHCR